MYLIRDVFQTKPGKSKELAQRFSKAFKFLPPDFKNTRVMVDFVANYWTVVLQMEVENMEIYLNQNNSFTSEAEVREIMEGYMDLVQHGHREIYKIES